MAILIVLNTASIQIIPTTVIAIRNTFLNISRVKDFQIAYIPYINSINIQTEIVK